MCSLGCRPTLISKSQEIANGQTLFFAPLQMLYFYQSNASGPAVDLVGEIGDFRGPGPGMVIWATLGASETAGGANKPPNAPSFMRPDFPTAVKSYICPIRLIHKLLHSWVGNRARFNVVIGARIGVKSAEQSYYDGSSPSFPNWPQVWCQIAKVMEPSGIRPIVS